MKLKRFSLNFMPVCLIFLLSILLGCGDTAPTADVAKMTEPTPPMAPASGELGPEQIFQNSACWQDQYGNQYYLNVDQEHNYITGTIISAQGCDAEEWYLLGSYVFKLGSGLHYEFTAANPLGDADSCVPAYKIKGIWPNGAWYYTDAYGGQEFTWVPCGSPLSTVGKRGRGMSR